MLTSVAINQTLINNLFFNYFLSNHDLIHLKRAVALSYNTGLLYASIDKKSPIKVLTKYFDYK